MGEFIKITIDQSKCNNKEKNYDWVNVCPAGIFEIENEHPIVVSENEDECTFCGLCLQECPTGAITIKKLYEP